VRGLRGSINSEVSEKEVILYSLLPRLVISTNSIAQNADFVALEL
jgi:hypothetical protein